MAVPALTRGKDMVFHADPHAGNLLYDRRRGELVILDWALTGHLTLPQRRCVLMLVLMTMLRDADGMTSAIEGLRLPRPADDSGRLPSSGSVSTASSTDCRYCGSRSHACDASFG